MGRPVGLMIADRSAARNRFANQMATIPHTDLCTSGRIIARLRHPFSGKQFVFRHSGRSVRTDSWRMYEVVTDDDGMKCSRTWETEAEMLQTLRHYESHGFVDVTTWNDRLFSTFTERVAPHVTERLHQKYGS